MANAFVICASTVLTEISRCSAISAFVSPSFLLNIKMILKEGLGGVQILADKEIESQFIKDYFIEGIPRFILLDPKGNIVSYDTPRPSEPELITLFDENGI